MIEILIEIFKEGREENPRFKKFSDKIFDTIKSSVLRIENYLKLAGKILLFVIKWSAIAFLVYIVLSKISNNPISLVVALLVVIVYQLDQINKKPPRD